MLDGMTNIKASKVLKELKTYTEDLSHYSSDEVSEALEMAINELEQQPTDAKETIIKSALKYLVKKQIEEGSVGFAVDNDPDNDCCWDDILAWLEEAQEQAIKEAYEKGYEYGVKDWFDKSTKAQTCIEDYPTCTECEHYDREKHYCPRFCQVIKDALAEAQPKVGKWMEVDDEMPIAYGCSECDSTVSRKYNYCPECGAEMSGGDEDE